jgi:hypothetical protein
VGEKAMKGHNLGKGLTILADYEAMCHFQHRDVDAFNAPSECHGLVARGHRKEFRTVRRKIKATTGLKFNEFQRECAKRTSDRYMYFGYQNFVDQMYRKAGYPF